MLNRKGYKEYTVNIGRKEWIKNWRLAIFWSLYLDVSVYYVDKAVTKYCDDNNIEFEFDGAYLYCISNRKQYNDIMKIIDEILYDEEDEDWE